MVSRSRMGEGGLHISHGRRQVSIALRASLVSAPTICCRDGDGPCASGFIPIYSHAEAREHFGDYLDRRFHVIIVEQLLFVAEGTL